MILCPSKVTLFREPCLNLTLKLSPIYLAVGLEITDQWDLSTNCVKIINGKLHVRSKTNENGYSLPIPTPQ